MDHVLIILGLLALWVLFVLASPTKACDACASHRGPCPPCNGTGRRFRFGARLVHRGMVKGHKEARRRLSARGPNTSGRRHISA
jgi:hypothetical protein